MTGVASGGMNENFKLVEVSGVGRYLEEILIIIFLVFFLCFSWVGGRKKREGKVRRSVVTSAELVNIKWFVSARRGGLQVILA